MILPSKALLDSVLKIETNSDEVKHQLSGDNIYYAIGTDCIVAVNIDRLIRLMKEWVKDKGYVIGVGLDRVNVWSIKERAVVNNFEVYFEDYDEATVKACEWILENKDS